jgi:hypothetical protein
MDVAWWLLPVWVFVLATLAHFAGIRLGWLLRERAAHWRRWPERPEGRRLNIKIAEKSGRTRR